MTEIEDFKELSKLGDPTTAELTIDFENGNSANFIINKHFNTSDDPLEQKYKLTATGHEHYYLVFQDATVQIIREDLDNLPFGPKRTVTNIDIQRKPNPF